MNPVLKLIMEPTASGGSGPLRPWVKYLIAFLLGLGAGQALG